MDLVALLVVFSDGEEEDPQLKDLSSEVQQKAIEAEKQVCGYYCTISFSSTLIASNQQLGN